MKRAKSTKPRFNAYAAFVEPIYVVYRRDLGPSGFGAGLMAVVFELDAFQEAEIVHRPSTGMPRVPRRALIKPLMPPLLPLDQIITVSKSHGFR